MFLLDTWEKPVTSSNVISGILNESQNRINLAALSEELISKLPAITLGWLHTSPTTFPSMRAKPMTIFLAKSFALQKGARPLLGE